MKHDRNGFNKARFSNPRINKETGLLRSIIESRGSDFLRNRTTFLLFPAFLMSEASGGIY
ncbi:MAG: hypothetical protein CBC13_04125 [Planctomycetia bacterium TMED53]|nr:MAG: hypothetical protein CBC13_04125 [Planctomycetia bacterium TMED53]